jgi:glyoxylase-like metal-dependent hydrolase (beta-lactamase superfamily II)
MNPAFDRTFEAPYGETVRLSPLVARLLADNPGPFTFRGTGVYMIGKGALAVVDPGPDTPAHQAVLERALAGRRVSHILVTHTHRDHSPAAKFLKQWSGAKTYGFGRAGTSGTEDAPVEESHDRDFVPDVPVKDGDVLEGEGFRIACVFTPGHTSNHMCYALEEEKALFSGDHVMGWSTSVIAPPDGDMRAYRASLEKLRARDDALFYPTHGAPVTDPQGLVRAYIGLRKRRAAQILVCLGKGLDTIPAIVARLYAGVDPRLQGAAACTVRAHLIELQQDGRVITDGERYYRA